MAGGAATTIAKITLPTPPVIHLPMFDFPSTSAEWTALLQQAYDAVTSPLFLAFVVMAATLPFGFLFWYNARPRLAGIPPYRERVVILGASSGTGEQLALEYAARGCRQLVLVGRREEHLLRVKEKCKEAAKKGEEWRMAQHAPGWDENQGKERYWTVKADCSDPTDVDTIRNLVMRELGGLDTLHICFGVSALKPLLGLANVDPLRPTRPSAPGSTLPASSGLMVHASLQGLRHLVSTVDIASHINLTATALCLATFVPIMQTSQSGPDPAVVLLSSAAAVFPAPTRALYAATKAAQLQLFESFALECESHAAHFERIRTVAKSLKRKPERRAAVRFIALCPGTIQTDFRASAVDVRPDEEGEILDSSWEKLRKLDGEDHGNGGSSGTSGGSGAIAAAMAGSAGADASADGREAGKKKTRTKGDILTPFRVADRAIWAVDSGAKGKILLPAKYTLAYYLKPFM